MKNSILKICILTILLIGSFILPGCRTPKDVTVVPNLPVKPIATVVIETHNSSLISWNGRILIAERTDANVAGNFAAFHAAKEPISNASIGFTNPSGIPDCYRMTEAWLRKPGNNEVYRATILPSLSGAATQFGLPVNAIWELNVQDAKGNWNAPTNGSFTVDGIWNPYSSELTTPQFMLVGVNEPHLFVALPAVMQNRIDYSQHLFEITRDINKVPALSTKGGQDIINGDDKFDPDVCKKFSTPLCPPTTTLPLPDPFIHGPGDQAISFATCGMTQLADNVSTRNLHMLIMKQGKLLYSKASDFSDAASKFLHFTVWADILPGFSTDFGEIKKIAVTGRSNTLIVAFTAIKNNRCKIWLTALYDNGTWKTPEDVFNASGDSPDGFPDEIQTIAIGNEFQFNAEVTDDPFSELLIAFSGLSDGGVYTITNTIEQKDWKNNGVLSNYSPMYRIRNGDVNSNLRVLGLRVNSVPFIEGR